MGKQSTVRIHDEGKIDIHQRALRFQRYLDTVKADDSMNPANKELILDFIRDCSLGKTIKSRAKKKIGPARCLKYMGMLRQLSIWFGKSFNDVVERDMDGLIQKLENDEIKQRSGRSYSEATKADIKKTIRKFWKWKDGDNKAYPELVEWIDTYVSVKDVPALKREEVEKMIEYASGPRNKALIMVLFDSGARVEELLNVRLKKEHLFWKEDLKCYMIRLEFSKTKPRTISLPLSTSSIRNWLEMHSAKDNPHAQLFPMTYPALKMVVYRLGKRALGKRVTPHMLRHSSATYYANRLKNPYKLCYRYGWTMASDMVNRYLDREGIMEHETAELVRADEVSAANRESQGVKEELTLVKEANADLQAKFEKVLDELTELKSGKGFMRLLMNLKSQEEEGVREALGRLTGKGFDFVLPRVRQLLEK